MVKPLRASLLEPWDGPKEGSIMIEPLSSLPFGSVLRHKLEMAVATEVWRRAAKMVGACWPEDSRDGPKLAILDGSP